MVITNLELYFSSPITYNVKQLQLQFLFNPHILEE